jgi:uncharacterized membrane protein YtjA (UPF0391 family)
MGCCREWAATPGSGLATSSGAQRMDFVAQSKTAADEAPRSVRDDHAEGATMLKWAIIFFVVSVIAGFFGFTGVASGARSVAKVLFFIAVAVFLVVLVFGVFMGKLVF